MKGFLENLYSRIRYSSPFVKIATAAILILLFISAFFFSQLFPLASADSIRAGLTLIAEMLGVLLGAILVIYGLSVDQLQRAESLFSNAFSQVLIGVKKDVNYIVEARMQLVRGVMSGKNTLGEKSSIDGITTLKKCITALSVLSITLKAEDSGFVWNQLKEIGYSESEFLETTFIASLLADTNAYNFFRLLTDGLSGINEWSSSKQLNAYWDKTYTAMHQAGISDALDRYESSRDFLGSWILSVTIFEIIITLFTSVATIFAVTEVTFHHSLIVIFIFASLLGFLASIVLLSLVLRRIFVIRGAK
jgi:hypothetical protein